jgi:Zn-dependent peptidase ImmA (M78 family)
MPFELLRVAYDEGIRVDYWDFEPPLEGIYIAIPDLPPIIGISNRLFECSPRFRCVLAEELGHHFTTAGDALPKRFFSYRDRLSVSKAEYRALKWAAECLIPRNKLERALRSGCTEVWSLAEWFGVTDEMVKFRLDFINNQEIYGRRQCHEVSKLRN